MRDHTTSHFTQNQVKEQRFYWCSAFRSHGCVFNIWTMGI